MEDSNLLRSLTETEASFEVRSKATYFPDFVIVYVPNTPFQKLKEGMELVKPIDNSKIDTNKKDETNAERSLRRTKKKIREYVLCNKFDMFVTFTFATERQDTDRCRSRMSDWLKNQQKRTGYFRYLIVPERHKDGALHFHALFIGYKGKVERATNPHTGKLLRKHGKEIYQLPSYKAGFTNVELIEDTPESRSRVAMYISKYITKDMPLFAHRNRYWASLRLHIPTVLYNVPPWYMDEEPEKVIEVEYGKLLIFPYRSKHDKYRDIVGLMEREES